MTTSRKRSRRPIPSEPPAPAPGVAPGPLGGSPGGTPSREAIAARAYARFLARGGTHGDDWADWLQAEAELRENAVPPADAPKS